MISKINTLSLKINELLTIANHAPPLICLAYVCFFFTSHNVYLCEIYMQYCVFETVMNLPGTIFDIATEEVLGECSYS